MTAWEALKLTRSAASEEEVQRQLDKAYEEIAKEAKRGNRKVLLAWAVIKENNPAFETVKERLLDDGYTISRHGLGSGQEYICW